MQVTLQSLPWVKISIFFVGWAAAMLANMLALTMTAKVNARLPEDRKFPSWKWGLQVRRMYKQLYPGDRLVLQMDSCVVVMTLALIYLVAFGRGGWL